MSIIRIGRRAMLAGGAGTAATLALPALGGSARADTVAYRIGVLNDMSGVYSASDGPGSVYTAKLAAADFMQANPGMTVDIVSGDMSTSVDTATTIARGWYDRSGVDAVIGIPQSAAAIAVGTIAHEKDKLTVFTGAGIADLTGKYCTANQVHWTYDLWENTNGTVRAIMATGGDTWFVIAPDYISGHMMKGNVEDLLGKSGGKLVGSLFYAFPGTTDFSSALLAAKSSGAKVICLANAGDDTTNCIKQAAEFGLIQGGQRIAGLVFAISNVDALGLKTAQGVVMTEGFYWDLNDGTRSFSKRFEAQFHRKASIFHAGSYSATTHILKAVAALGPDKARASGRAMVEKMKELPTQDAAFGKGSVRADGKFIHPAYVFQVKSPAESHYPSDDYRLLATIPADQAFMPMSEEGCALIKT
jgi:branched-chain amino acid transport system substrate-binding protein